MFPLFFPPLLLSVFCFLIFLGQVRGPWSETLTSTNLLPTDAARSSGRYQHWIIQDGNRAFAPSRPCQPRRPSMLLSSMPAFDPYTTKSFLLHSTFCFLLCKSNICSFLIQVLFEIFSTDSKDSISSFWFYTSTRKKGTINIFRISKYILCVPLWQRDRVWDCCWSAGLILGSVDTRNSRC